MKFKDRKQEIIDRIERYGDDAMLDRVENAIIDDAIKARLAQMFDIRGVPTSGATFNFVRHDIIPHMNGGIENRIEQIGMMQEGKMFDIDLFLWHGSKGITNIYDYTTTLSAESKSRLLSYAASDWSQHSVGKGEAYIHLLTKGSVKGTSHDITHDGKKIEVKGMRSRLSSSACVNDIEVVIRHMTNFIQDLPIENKSVFQKFNKSVIETEYLPNLTLEQYRDLVFNFADILYINNETEFTREMVDSYCQLDIESTKLVLSVLEFENYKIHVGFDYLVLLNPDTGDALVLEEVADVFNRWRYLKPTLEYNYNHQRSNSIAWSII